MEEHKYGDMIAKEQSDGTYKVRFASSSRLVGRITPADGAFIAEHVDTGPAGTYPSIREALLGIWQED